LNLLAKGNKPSLEEINQVVHGSVKGKSYELFRSIQGYFTEHHALLLRTNLETIEFHERQVALLDECLETMMANIEPLIQELDKIPGIDKVSARAILAEIGISLDDFKSSGHLCAWAGLCPGNNESGGKRKTGRSPVKKHVLKTVLVEVAWAAIKKKNSFFKEKYYRLKLRTTPKKAIVAIAHKILKVVYHIVKHGVEYHELGADYLHRQNEKATLRRLEKQAANFGLKLVPIGA
jgi:transposase